MYKVDLSTKARKFYEKADQSLARKLARCFEQLEKDPRHHPNIKPLVGSLAGRYPEQPPPGQRKLPTWFPLKPPFKDSAMRHRRNDCRPFLALCVCIASFNYLHAPIYRSLAERISATSCGSLLTEVSKGAIRKRSRCRVLGRYQNRSRWQHLISIGLSFEKATIAIGTYRDENVH